MPIQRSFASLTVLMTMWNGLSSAISIRSQRKRCVASSFVLHWFCPMSWEYSRCLSSELMKMNSLSSILFSTLCGAFGRRWPLLVTETFLHPPFRVDVLQWSQLYGVPSLFHSWSLLLPIFSSLIKNNRWPWIIYIWPELPQQRYQVALDFSLPKSASSKWKANTIQNLETNRFSWAS